MASWVASKMCGLRYAFYARDARLGHSSMVGHRNEPSALSTTPTGKGPSKRSGRRAVAGAGKLIIGDDEAHRKSRYRRRRGTTNHSARPSRNQRQWEPRKTRTTRKTRKKAGRVATDETQRGTAGTKEENHESNELHESCNGRTADSANVADMDSRLRKESRKRESAKARKITGMAAMSLRKARRNGRLRYEYRATGNLGRQAALVASTETAQVGSLGVEGAGGANSVPMFTIGCNGCCKCIRWAIRLSSFWRLSQKIC